jgi:hypothetical protein
MIDEEGNILNPVGFAALGATTCDSKAKSKGLTADARRGEWWSRLTPEEKRAFMTASACWRKVSFAGSRLAVGASFFLPEAWLHDMSKRWGGKND